MDPVVADLLWVLQSPSLIHTDALTPAGTSVGIDRIECILKADGFIRLDKRQWLARLAPQPRTVLDTRSMIIAARATIATSARPFQLVGVDAAGRELHRGFVTPADWPR